MVTIIGAFWCVLVRWKIRRWQRRRCGGHNKTQQGQKVLDLHIGKSVQHIPLFVFPRLQKIVELTGVYFSVGSFSSLYSNDRLLVTLSGRAGTCSIVSCTQPHMHPKKANIDLDLTQPVQNTHTRPEIFKIFCRVNVVAGFGQNLPQSFHPFLDFSAVWERHLSL